MNMDRRASIFFLVLLIAAGFGGACRAQQSEMSFFVTSAGSGRGADLGAWLVRIGFANNLRRRRGPAAAHGTPISAHRRQTDSRQSTLATASDTGRGATAKAS